MLTKHRYHSWISVGASLLASVAMACGSSGSGASGDGDDTDGGDTDGGAGGTSGTGGSGDPGLGGTGGGLSSGGATTDGGPSAGSGGSAGGDGGAPDAETICRERFYECGKFMESEVGLVDCGECSSGDFCVRRRCEPKCESEIMEGPHDGLAAHVMLRISEEDVSANDLDVVVDGPPAEWLVEEWVSQTDVEHKSLTIPTESLLSDDFTISFRLLPKALEQDGEIASLGNLSVSQEGTSIRLQIEDDALVHDSAPLRQYDCNHVAVVVSGTTARLVVNGEELTGDLDAAGLVRGDWRIGNYAGKVWDLRAYARALDASEVDQSAGRCVQERVAADAISDDAEGAFSYYQCGLFVCAFVPPAALDLDNGENPLSQDNLDYNLTRQDEVNERNILLSGLYPDGDLCGYLSFLGNEEHPSHRDLPWGSGLRGTFYRPHDWDKPASQHWLHENFHSFQGTLGDYGGPGGGPKWRLEGQASWGAFLSQPGVNDTLLGAYTLQPQVPLYADQRAPAPFAAETVPGVGAHQYGSSIWMTYLMYHTVKSPAYMGVWVNHPRQPDGGTVKELIQVLDGAGYDMADAFIEFAAHVSTWDMFGYHDEEYRKSENDSLNRMINRGEGYTDTDAEGYVLCEAGNRCDSKFVETYDATGTEGNWVTVPQYNAPGNWAYNSYRVSTNGSNSFTVSLRTSSSNPADGEYRAMAVAYDTASGKRVYMPLEVAAPGAEASTNVDTTGADEMIVVFAVTPHDWAPENDWAQHMYDLKIE